MPRPIEPTPTTGTSGPPGIDDLLHDRFGLRDFRPGQREVIEALVRDGAALAVFPTGGGKSLCYQLPSLRWSGLTIVVSPLIALMKDQIDALRAQDIPAARLDSTLAPEEVRAVNEQVRDGSLRLLYVAPERFTNERFRALLARTPIALFALDEAHCLSEWGHNFRPDYLKLPEVARALGAERVLALTATATPPVVSDICRSFGIPAANAVVIGFYRPNLTFLTTPVRSDARDQLLLDRLRTREAGATIVYVTLQRTAERLATMLAGAGVPARAYHAGMESTEREAVQEWWMRHDGAVMVATIAFGMGIDKAEVRYVYHYNLPKGLESYAQETGRAGRDGRAATVELFACRDDVPVLENFAYGDTPTEEAVNGLVEELQHLDDRFAVSLNDLSNRFDIRPLVLRTALTYLELEGALLQGTPFYAGYECKPRLPLPDVMGRFSGEPAQFLKNVFTRAKKGRVWYALDPDGIADALDQPRDRVIRALEYLDERGLVTLRAADVRHQFAWLHREGTPGAFTEQLLRRFVDREAQEVMRVGRVLDLVQSRTCQVNALVGYFGERREAPCGHCSVCLTGPVTLPEVEALAPMDGVVRWSEVQALRDAHPSALSKPRQQARFLCGLSSPAVARARLSGHRLFGSLAAYPFAEVMAWCG